MSDQSFFERRFTNQNTSGSGGVLECLVVLATLSSLGYLMLCLATPLIIHIAEGIFFAICAGIAVCLVLYYLSVVIVVVVFLFLMVGAGTVLNAIL